MKQYFFGSRNIPGFAKILAVLVLSTYPFSHFPLLPVAGISPFQLLAAITGVLGIIAAISWLLGSLKKYKISKVAAHPVFWLVLLLTWMSASYLWGGQSKRQLYFIALCWLGMFFAVGTYWLIKTSRLGLQTMARIILVAGAALSLFAVYQFVGETLGISRSYTQICISCTESGVGFARASGFSQEPQFLSTVLFLPIAMALLLLVEGRSILSKYTDRAGITVIFLAFLLSSSRGGLLALFVFSAGCLVLSLIKRKLAFARVMLASLMVAFVLALGFIAWSGTTAHHPGSRYSLERYIAHISNGKIQIGGEAKRVAATERAIGQKKASEQQGSFNYINGSAGYGQEGALIYSAQSRVETYKTALSLWRRDTKTLLIGVGWGSFGTAAHQRQPNVFVADNIVNNQPLEFAVELGAVGVALAAAAAISFVYLIARSKLSQNAKVVVLLLLAAYATQLMFYSAFHLLQFWLSFALIFYLLTTSEPVILNKKRKRFAPEGS